MKRSRIPTHCVLPILCAVLWLTRSATAQEVVALYPGAPPGATTGNYPEQQYMSKQWNTEVVSNVTVPTLTVFQPLPELKNGTAVVICPGGGFVTLSINSEGFDVAKYLAARGVTAFVLKYRLAHTGNQDAEQEFVTLFADPPKFHEMMQKVEPLSAADGLAAVTYVRQHALQWGLSPDRVGIIGFSAGGIVTAEVAFHYKPEGRPAFVAPIYGAAPGDDPPVPADAPPMFIAAATDDQLGLMPQSIALYKKWTDAHKSAELHIYAKGGHGFGMSKHGIPTDHWIDRFTDWMQMQGWLQK
jgi:acetyl esterase/lipase